MSLGLFSCLPFQCVAIGCVDPVLGQGNTVAQALYEQIERTDLRAATRALAEVRGFDLKSATERARLTRRLQELQGELGLDFLGVYEGTEFVQAVVNPQAGISNLEVRHAVRSTYSSSSRKFGSGGEERSTGARAMLGAAPLDPAADQTEQDAARHDHDRRAEQRETEPRQVFHGLEACRGRRGPGSATACGAHYIRCTVRRADERTMRRR